MRLTCPCLKLAWHWCSVDDVVSSHKGQNIRASLLDVRSLAPTSSYTIIFIHLHSFDSSVPISDIGLRLYLRAMPWSSFLFSNDASGPYFRTTVFVPILERCLWSFYDQLCGRISPAFAKTLPPISKENDCESLAPASSKTLPAIFEDNLCGRISPAFAKNCVPFSRTKTMRALLPLRQKLSFLF